MESSQPSHLDPANYPHTHVLPNENIHIELTYHPLDPLRHISNVRSPDAGANVLFLGTTRSNFEGRSVSRLAYTSYGPMALRTFTNIAREAADKYSLKGISIAHRLGEVKVGEESIAIAVSAAHRRAAWSAGEEVLEHCKDRVEIWKREEFADGPDGDGEWRANRDRDADGHVVTSK
ncbi:Molybdopterin synthase catalytic subunit [Myotisia sp. PD_48]|nr:Molybdopterin synthase catalytic subunit [Myotisia sp. PD_48]